MKTIDTIKCLFIVVMVHGEYQSRETESLDGLTGHRHPLIHGLQLLVCETAKYKIDLCALLEIVAYTESQPRVLLGAKQLRDVLQTIVAAIAAIAFETQFTEGQSKVIDHHQQPFQFHVLFVEPVPHCQAAEVHVCGRLEQHQFIS